jgi:hypothetical protein
LFAFQPSGGAVWSVQGADEAGVVGGVAGDAAAPVLGGVVGGAEAGGDDVAAAGHGWFDRLPDLARVTHSGPLVHVSVRAGVLNRGFLVGRVGLGEPVVVAAGAELVDVGGRADDGELEPAGETLEAVLDVDEEVSGGVFAATEEMDACISVAKADHPGVVGAGYRRLTELTGLEKEHPRVLNSHADELLLSGPKGPRRALRCCRPLGW